MATAPAEFNSVEEQHTEKHKTMSVGTKENLFGHL